MIVFELTMPNRGSWNNKWSGESTRHIKVKYDNAVPKDLWNKDFFYRWDDGWTACISVIKMSSKEARKLEKESSGFCGYDWMIDSIIKYHNIIKPTH